MTHRSWFVLENLPAAPNAPTTSGVSNSRPRGLVVLQALDLTLGQHT